MADEQDAAPAAANPDQPDQPKRDELPAIRRRGEPADALSLMPSEVAPRALQLINRQLRLIEAAQARVAAGLQPVIKEGRNLGCELSASEAASAMSALSSSASMLLKLHASFAHHAQQEAEDKPVDPAAAEAVARKLLTTLQRHDARKAAVNAKASDPKPPTAQAEVDRHAPERSELKRDVAYVLAEPSRAFSAAAKRKM